MYDLYSVRQLLGLPLPPRARAWAWAWDDDGEDGWMDGWVGHA